MKVVPLLVNRIISELPEVDPRWLTINDGFNALMFAAVTNDLELARKLLLDPRIDVHAETVLGKTALDFATSEEMRKLLRISGL